MSTPLDIITPALEKLGEDSVISPADPSSFSKGLEQLQRLIGNLSTDGIATAGIFPVAISTEMQEPEYARQALIDILALRMATNLQLAGNMSASELQVLKTEAASSMRVLRNANMNPKFKRIPLDFPLGTGYDYYRRYFVR
jgi:hypothetical protein